MLLNTTSPSNYQHAHQVQKITKKGPFVIERNDKCGKPSEKKVDVWNILQKKKYLAFIYYFQQEISSKSPKQLWQIYKQMHIFIKDRNKNQCRMYHLSMLKKYTTLRGIIINAQRQTKNIAQISYFYNKQLSQLNIKAKEEVKGDLIGEDNDGQMGFDGLIKQSGQEREYKKDELDNIRTDLTFNQPQEMPNNKNYNSQDQQHHRNSNRQSGRYFEHSLFGCEKPSIPSFPSISSIDYPVPVYNYYNYGFPFPGAPFFREEMQRAQKVRKEGEWRQCHELFLAWTSKLRSLLQQEG